MLTQLATVKMRLGLSDSTQDALLTNFIKHASERFDRHCRRKFSRLAGATDEFDGGRRELALSRYPIESVTKLEVKRRESEGWVEQTGVEFLVRRGCVVSLGKTLGGDGEVLRVTYTGGYVLPGTTPGAGQTALPDDLEQACVEQVAYWYQSKDHLGVITEMQSGVGFNQFTQMDLLMHVRAVLDTYVRMEG
jgi:hypothetical protein